MRESITKFREQIERNSKTVLEAYPKFAEAAEIINQTFWDLTDHETHLTIPKKGKSYGAVEGLCYGAHGSWVHALIFASAGLTSEAYAALRRAIEFTAYSAKILGKDKRVELWERRSESTKSRRAFAGSFGIPTAYLQEKYRCLFPLLVAFELASDLGVHANHEVVALGMQRQKSGDLRYSYHEDKGQVWRRVALVLIVGRRIIQALRAILAKQLRDTDTLDAQIALLERSLRDARLETLPEGASREAVDAIRLDDQAAIIEILKKICDRDEIPYDPGLFDS